MMLANRRVILAVVLVALLLAAAVGLLRRPSEPSPIVTPAPDATESSLATSGAPSSDGDEEEPSSEANQVGPDDRSIEQQRERARASEAASLVIAGRPEDFVVLEPLLAATGTIRLEQLSRVPALDERPMSAIPDEGIHAMHDLEFRQYSYSGPVDAARIPSHVARAQLYQLVATALAEERTGASSPAAPLVFIDPNSLMFVAQVSPSTRADPNDGIVPVSLTSTPTTGGPFVPTPMSAKVQNQWALQPTITPGAGTPTAVYRGIALVDPADGSRLDSTQLGAGQRVAIFDTWPDQAGTGVATPVAVSIEHPVNDASSTTMTFDSMDPFALTQYASLLPTPPPQDVSGKKEHGMFAAGLVHVVAPAAQIELVRAVSDDGYSNLQSLAAAFSAYFRFRGLLATSPAPADDALSDTTFHLSWSIIDVTQAASETVLVSNAISDVVQQLDDLIDTLDDGPRKTRLVAYRDKLTTTTATDLPSLQAPIDLATSYDAVVVGAVGNEALGNASDPRMPAKWASVIGVGGTKIDGMPSCFSRKVGTLTGGISAPSGTIAESACVKSGTPEPACSSCDDTHLIGRISDDVIGAGTPGVPDGYAYWIGTSFSTSFVAGASALRRGQCPDEPRDEILADIAASGSTLPSNALVSKGLNANALIATPCP